MAGIASMDPVTRARGGVTALTFQKSKRLSPDLALTRSNQPHSQVLLSLGLAGFQRMLAGVVAACVMEAGHRRSCQRQMLYQQNHRFSIILEFIISVKAMEYRIF